MILSKEELQVVKNMDFLKLKRTALNHIRIFFENSKPILSNLLKSCSVELLNDVDFDQHKVSHGENYRELPYVVLDVPNHFKKQDQFAFRVVFLWGKGLSCSLHLAGKYKDCLIPSLVHHLSTLRASDFSGCIYESPWEHLFEPWNFLPLSTYSNEKWNNLWSEEVFLKIGFFLPLEELPTWESQLEERLKRIVAAFSPT